MPDVNATAARVWDALPHQQSMKRVVVLSGAGISAESGLQTFRGADGLWEGHRVEDVASPEGWAAGLVFEAPKRARRIVVNPDLPEEVSGPAFEVVAKTATVGVPQVVYDLLASTRA
jgi:hypothetical protein